MEDGIETIRLKATGQSSLILHNGQLIDPLNRFSKMMKEISSKRKKTESDLMELGKIEFFGGLYTGNGKNANKLIIPAEMMTAAIIKGAMKGKMGPQFKAGVFVPDESRIIFEDMDKTPQELYDTGKYTFRCNAKIGKQSIMRTRPKIDNWSVEFDISYDKSLVNQQEVLLAVAAAGRQCGIGDWRPQFGRFTVEKIDG